MKKTSEPRNHVPDQFSEKQLQVYVRQMLCGQVFVGKYIERRFVPQLKCYRDVVELCSKEKDMRETLEAVQVQMPQLYEPGNVWTGISSTESPYKLCLHVSLNDVAFGRYWFLLKSIKFTGTEVVIQLKCLRPIAEADAIFEENSGPGEEVNWAGLWEDWKRALSRGAGTAIAVENVRHAAVFLVVVLTGLLTGTVHLVRHLGDFTIRLVHEISGLVRALMPLALGIIDFVSKCVGGLFILVASLLRGRSPAPPMFHAQSFPQYPRDGKYGKLRPVEYGYN